MKFPFPGMDPYLEDVLWPDVHASLILAVRAALVRQLPERYAAVVGQNVWLEGPDDDDRRLLCGPDVTVPETRTGSWADGAATAVLEAPVQTTLAPAVARPGPRYIRITDREMRRVITVLEVLSPSNKDPGEGRAKYLAKRDEYRDAGVNLVEIDLLRAGPRLPLGEPAPAPSDYCYLVSRAASFPQAGIWPFSVRDAIPLLPVPLGPGDADVVVDLRACLDAAYADARYDRLIDYRKAAVPPLAPADAEWAAAFLPRA